VKKSTTRFCPEGAPTDIMTLFSEKSDFITKKKKGGKIGSKKHNAKGRVQKEGARSKKTRTKNQMQPCKKHTP